MRFVVPSVISHATFTVSPALKGGGSSLSMAASCLASNSAMIVPVLMPLRAARQVWRGAGAGASSADRRREDGEDAHRRACGFGDGLVLFWTTRWHRGDVGGGVYNCNRALRCRLVQAELLPRLVAS